VAVGAGESVAFAVASVDAVGEVPSLGGESVGATGAIDAFAAGAVLSAGRLVSDDGCVAIYCLWSSTVSSINWPEAS